MRYDIEIASAQLFADYLNALCSVADGYVMEAKKCPIVTFFDPMSVDDADRCTVMCPDADIDIADTGRFKATMDIGLKKLWAQPTIKADFDVHFQRVQDVRDKLMPIDIVTRLKPFLPDGMVIDFVQPRRQFKTHIAESTQAKWIYSGTMFDIEGYFTAAA
ncbi:MAG: hypothetical protein WCH99_08890 [Verrucomicrobiota bacterium]